MPAASSRPPGYPQILSDLVETWRFPQPPLQVNLLEQLTELREILTFTSLLKDMIKDTDEQPDEEIHRVRSGRVPSAGASVPVELGCITLLVCGCVHPPGSFRKSMLLGFYGGFLT